MASQITPHGGSKEQCSSPLQIPEAQVTGFVTLPYPGVCLLKLVLQWMLIAFSSVLHIAPNLGDYLLLLNGCPLIGNSRVTAELEHLITGSQGHPLTTSQLPFSWKPAHVNSGSTYMDIPTLIQSLRIKYFSRCFDAHLFKESCFYLIGGIWDLRK